MADLIMPPAVLPNSNTFGAVGTGVVVPPEAASMASKEYVDTGLAGKSDTGHTHVLDDVTGLAQALADGDAGTLSDAKTYTDNQIAAIPAPDLAGLVTDAELADGLATKADGGHHHDGSYDPAGAAAAALDAAKAYAEGLEPDLSGLATKAELADGLATKADGGHHHDGSYDPAGAAAAALDAAKAYAEGLEPDLSGLATKTELADGLAGKAANDHTHAEYLTADDLPQPPDLSGLATKTELADGLATKADGGHTHAEYLTSDDLPQPYDDTALVGRVQALETATPAVAVVEHGTNASAPRPAAEVVLWYGSVEPTNAQPNDQWYGGGVA